MITNLKQLTSFISSVAGDLHKWAALGVGLSAGAGLIPGSATSTHIEAIVGASYAAICPVIDELGKP